ncbi:MAG: AMP-binding protein [Bacteriovorax sp.]|jgi:phenylacetate-CoA ligase
MTVQKWTLKEIVDHAKKYSPFYADLYADIQFEKLADLPITDQSSFWKGNVLTSDKRDGIVFKSGGSTGAPKYSYFTSLEWQSFTESFGWGMSRGILDDYDRVANLFYVGDLYASFLFIKDSLQWIPTENKKILQFPIAGATDPKAILKALEEFSINVMAGVPSAILTLLEYYEKEKRNYPNVKIEKLLFGGEALYPDQYDALKRIFPEIKISSIGYASVDAGLLGYSDRTCHDGEHRVFDRANIIEIVDPDTDEVITEQNRVGKVLITNLTRKLMPIIRYPAGDLAMWTESSETPYRKFKLMGRSDEAARLGTISVYFEDTRIMVMNALSEFSGLQFQMILKHFDHKDELILRMAAHGLKPDSKIVDRVIEAFKKEKPVYSDVLAKKLIHPIKVEIVEMRQLEGNARTGKLKRVIDDRGAK